jgi:hypothetical protein
MKNKICNQLGDGVMETHSSKDEGLVGFDSLPPKGIYFLNHGNLPTDFKII